MTGRNRKLLPLAALLLAASSQLALSGCQQQAAAPAAAPEGAPGVAVTNARVILPAVKGNPAAIYFDAVYTGSASAEIAGADLAGAGKTELHETANTSGMGGMEPLAKIPLVKNEPVHFAPGGKHIMAFDLDPSLTPGGKAELTLLLADGDKVTVAADVKAPGSEASTTPMGESAKP